MTQTKQCIEWIKNYYKDNPDGKAIIGISGGKDSTIAAALCVEALGADRVIGVMMPDGAQIDIADSAEVCSILGIESLYVDIAHAYWGLSVELATAIYGDRRDIQPVSEVVSNKMYATNTPARIRMTTLYAIAAFYPNSRVVNTCNRSEDYVGYSTKFGDAAGDFSPLGNLTVREVLAIGDELGLPEHLVHKAPSDGMCGKTDEDNLGFTYNELDDFLLGTGDISEETYNKIERLHTITRHKYEPMPTFSPINYDGILGQMSIYDLPTFDYTKQQKRGLRAESGIILDEYAEGGLVAPELTGLASGQNGCSAAINVEPINYGETDLQKIAEAINKVIETAGYAFREKNNGIQN